MKFIFSFRYFKEIYYALTFLMGVLVVGTIGFMYLENYSFLDAFYMTVITVSTVGYGEVVPLGTAGKLFVSFLIISTFGTFAFAVSSITRYLISGDYRIYFKNYKVMSELEKLDGHVIICGYGRNGQQAVRTLEAHDQKAVVIESNEQIINRLRASQDPIILIEGDATDDSVITKAGIEKARALITTLPSDADNLFVVLTARDLNKELTIISRASSTQSERKLRIAGANNVILPDKVGGSHMASLVTTPDLMDFLDHISITGKDDSTLVEVTFQNLPDELAQKTIKELELKYQTGSRIIGYKTPMNEIIVNPAPDTILVPKSKLFVIGNAEQIKRLRGVLEFDD